MHAHTCAYTYMYTCILYTHAHMHIYVHTHAHVCTCVLTNTHSWIQITYIQVHAHTHTHVHMHTSAHICFLNICLSYHPCSSFVFSFTRSLHTALLPCLRDALDGSRQFSLHHGSLFMCSSAFLMADQTSIFRLDLVGASFVMTNSLHGNLPMPSSPSSQALPSSVFPPQC